MGDGRSMRVGVYMSWTLEGATVVQNARPNSTSCEIVRQRLLNAVVCGTEEVQEMGALDTCIRCAFGGTRHLSTTSRILPDDNHRGRVRH